MSALYPRILFSLMIFTVCFWTSPALAKSHKNKSLTINTFPSGAEVVFNSIKQGPSPTVVVLTKKLNRIVVQMKGYKTYDVMIEKNTLRHQMTIALNPVEIPTTQAPKPEMAQAPSPASVSQPTPAPSASTPPTETGIVFFSSSPSQAEIRVDGKSTGRQTPVKFKLSVGTHHIDMQYEELKGQADYQVIPGYNKALLLELQ